MRSRIPKFSAWLFCLLVLVIVFVIVAHIYIRRNNVILVPQKPFEATEWIGCKPPTRLLDETPTIRQMMISDLVGNVLPELNRQQVEELLGESPTFDKMRRSRFQEPLHGSATESGENPQPGIGGYYFDEYQWDLMYPIGIEQTFLWDHRGQLLDPSSEYLLLRFDRNGKFESWFIVGSRQWPRIVGARGTSTYRRTRKAPAPRVDETGFMQRSGEQPSILG